MPHSPNYPASISSPPYPNTTETSQSKLIVCDHCKRLKRKCDRKLPTCTRCQLGGTTCQYGQSRRRPGPAKGAVNSRTRALMDRINELENIVQNLSERSVTTVPSSSLPVDINDSAMWPEAEIQGACIFSDTLTAASPIRSHLSQGDEFLFELHGLSQPNSTQVPTTSVSGDMDGLSASTLLPATEQLLASLYFDHIQPTFPLFRKPVFYQNLITHQIPDMLLTAMFALSSRFLPLDKMQNLFGDMSNPWDRFSHTANKKFREELQGNDPVSPIHVKTACLLALYEYTKKPSREAWILVGNAVRLALMAQLHQVECLNLPPSVSDGEREEWRFVWWTIWRLDCTVNVTACTPFGIDNQMIGTALVTTTVEDFTAGVVNASKPVIPEMDPTKSWASPLGPQFCDTGDGFNTHLFATSLLRAVSECQQRLNIKPSPEEIGRVAALDDILSTLHVILPEWFFNPCRQEMEKVHSHRLRLETGIMLNTAQLIAHEPVHQLIMGMSLSSDSRTVSLKSWRDSIGSAETIALILDEWPTDYFAVSDPIISCAIWHAYCGLTLYGMSGLEPSTSDSKIQASLESLRTSLERFTAYWPIARVLQDSLQVFQSWSWATVDIRKLVDLIGHTRKALSPYTSEPGSLDVALLCDAVL